MGHPKILKVYGDRYLQLTDEPDGSILQVKVPKIILDTEARAIAGHYPAGTPDRVGMIAMALALYGRVVR